MKKMDNLDAYQWIQEETVNFQTDEQEGSRVENFLPHRFNHYCKIIHPLYRDPQIEDENLLWSDISPEQTVEIQLGERLRLMELAEKYGLKPSKELSAASLMLKLGATPRYIISGEQGEIEPESLMALIQILEHFTGEENCSFLYDLLKTKDYAATLFQGKLAEVIELSNSGGLRGTPTYYWPADRSWCLFSDIDLDFTVIGGSRELVDALLKDEFLECTQCDAATRIDNQADFKN